MGSQLPSTSRLSALEKMLAAAKDDAVEEVVDEFVEREVERVAERLKAELAAEVASIQTPDQLKIALESARRRFQTLQLGLEKNSETIEFLSLDHFIQYYQEDKHHYWIQAVNKTIKDQKLLKGDIAKQMGYHATALSRRLTRKKGRFTNEELTQLWAILSLAS